MSTAYEDSGRRSQKQRTRAALVDAARRLITEGGAAPTVPEAADAASISRTTAYRYFANQRALLAAAHPETERASLLPDDIGEDPEVRLQAAVATFVEMVVATEAQQRTMLRLSLDDSTVPDQLPLRKGRGIRWFEDALSPLLPELGAAAVRGLAIGVRSAVGIESLVWLVDVAGLTREEASAQMQTTALALLRHSTSGATSGI
ncbi:MAG: helix-turn-helix domain-containing protein [Marmoricola sp.]